MSPSKGNWEKYNHSLLKSVRSKTLYSGDIQKAFSEITEAASYTVNVERSSIWFYNDNHSSLSCADLFQKNAAKHSIQDDLQAVDFPAYFKALEENRAIDADDAYHDSRTQEFSRIYLKPLGISSMLDAPIHYNGQTYGVICLEHVGPPRQWTPEEITYAGSLADLASLALAARERKQSESALLRSEEQLRQAQKMEAVGQLTGGIAHDFNNLLAVIFGNLEMLSDCLNQDENAMGYVNSALSAARRGADLTHRLLAFSRKQALAPTIIEPAKLIDGLQDLITRTLGETIRIDIIHRDDLWHCLADQAQTENALINLAINARDAMPKGGKLTIDVSNATLDGVKAAQFELKAGDYVAIAVTDTGTGIPNKMLDKVFDPFFTTKAIGKGSGLGLSMVYGFARQSGGHVAISSEEGTGTTVKIFLPRTQPAPPQAAHSDPETEPRSQGETILVVEDDPDVRALMVAQLHDMGYETLEAGDAEKALAEFERSTKLDMLFTDVVLPGPMSGPDLAKEVLRRCPDLPVLFTSGYTDGSFSHQSKPDSNAELLNKPFRKIDLARKVRSVLDKTQASYRRQHG